MLLLYGGVMFDQADFNRELDTHQAREAAEAEEREAEASVEALRPDALPTVISFDELRPGDFMTAERGPGARWVEVVAVGPGKLPGAVGVRFRTPQPLGLGLHELYTIERGADDTVTIDRRARP